MWREGDIYSVGSLWEPNRSGFQKSCFLVFRISDDGQSPETQWFRELQEVLKYHFIADLNKNTEVNILFLTFSDIFLVNCWNFCLHETPVPSRGESRTRQDRTAASPSHVTFLMIYSSITAHPQLQHIKARFHLAQAWGMARFLLYCYGAYNNDSCFISLAFCWAWHETWLTFVAFCTCTDINCKSIQYLGIIKVSFEMVTI
jgi:hypothetical protein